MKATIARRLAPRNLKQHDMQPQPLVVTDDELSHIFQAAMPIALDRRDALLEQVAGLLRGCTGPIGLGTVHRAIEQAQRLYFNPPENDHTPSRARWDRDAPKFERALSRLRAECLIPDTAARSLARLFLWLAGVQPTESRPVDAAGLAGCLRGVGNEARRRPYPAGKPAPLPVETQALTCLEGGGYLLPFAGGLLSCALSEHRNQRLGSVLKLWVCRRCP
jgi:hypothetical protein